MTADPDYWHEKGQRDYPDNWNPPIDDISGLLTNYDEGDIINMAAYKAGWANAREQAD
jgi:hypothetical protein